MSGGAGWGGGPWGLTSWGGGPDDDLALAVAVAMRENVLRLEFNVAPLFTGVLDQNDASNPARYAIVAVDGTVGLDGNPVRAVRPVLIAQPAIVGGGGRYVDVTVDRTFSPFPTQYRISVNNLVTTYGLPMDLGATSVVFHGLTREYVPSLTEAAVPSRDIASPQTRSAALDPLPDVSQLVLGTYPVNDAGDYAFDEGLVNLKKRIFRRLFTRKGGFLFLPSYGIGVGTYAKKLNQAAVRQRLAVEAERQILREPEVSKARVRFIDRAPGLVVLQVLVRTVHGAGFRMDAPLKAA